MMTDHAFHNCVESVKQIAIELSVINLVLFKDLEFQILARYEAPIRLCNG